MENQLYSGNGKLMKKIFLILLFSASDCFPQFIPQFNRQPEVGYQINLAHPDAQGLRGSWLLNEGLGMKAYDLSPFANDGTLTNMTEADWVAGRDGYALDFDGVNDYVDLGDNNEKVNIASDNHTISLWAKWSFSGTSLRTLFIIGDDSFTHNTAITTSSTNDGGVAFTRGTHSPGQPWHSTNALGLNDGNWHHIVAIWDGTLSMYVDGESKSLNVSTYTFNIDINAIANRTFGGETFFLGSIADVRLYTRAWTAEEVLSLFINSYAMFEQPPGRILAAAAAAAARRRPPLIF